MVSEEEAISKIDVGSLEAIFLQTPERIPQPIVQCVQVKPMQNAQGGETERFRVVFSDTKHYVQTMLATTANEEVHADRLRRGVLVRLVQYQANHVKNKKILIVTQIECLPQYGEHPKLGNPTPLEVKEEPGTGTTSGAGSYAQPNQQQSRSMVSRDKPPSSSSSHANISPIELLSPYSHKWTIKARCTNKSDIKTWHNKNGEGKLFSVNLLDESGEIRATGFNDSVDNLYDLFQENSVYYISSPCRIQIAKKQFSNVNNDYELTFERETVVEKAEESDDVPQVRYNFTSVSDLQSVEKDTTVDIIGVLTQVGDVDQIVSKTTNNPYNKRELTLVDDSNYSVRLTIWGKTANQFDVPVNSVVAFKGLKVSDFGGRSLSLLSSGSLAANPDIPQAHRLRGWYDGQGSRAAFQTHAGVEGTVAPGQQKQSQAKTIAQVEEEGLGKSEKGDYFDLKASIISIRQGTYAYPACQREDCNKKLLEEGDKWYCAKHEQAFDKPNWRYILSLTVADHTGQKYMNCFNNEGEMILGKPADQLKEIEAEDPSALEAIFSEANCRMYNFRVRAKLESYQDKEEVRFSVSSASKIDFAGESRNLAKLIQQYDGMSLKAESS